MRKLIGFFALLIMISFATGWTASQPPGNEVETEYTVSMDMDVLVPVIEIEQSQVYTPIILPHNAGDIQCREAINPIKDTQDNNIYFMITGELLYSNNYDNYSQSVTGNENRQRTFATNDQTKWGLYRLDIGEYLCVFKT